MLALLFRHEVGRYVACRLATAMGRREWTPALSPLHLVTRDRPQASNPGWTEVNVRLAGICGSDLRMVTGGDSLYLEPEATYPFVPGHEVVGEVAGGDLRQVRVDAGPLHTGDRVVVWPVLGCRSRGHAELCPPCLDGWEGLCRKRDSGWPGRGLSIGFNRDTGGGWSEALLAHSGQLWLLPDTVSDEDAVLLDPAATALASLLRGARPTEARTLIIGGGTIGLLAGLLHQALPLSGACELIVRYPHQLEWARAHGLEAALLKDERDFEKWASDRFLSRTRVTGYGTVYRGNYDRVIDSAGSRTSMEWAIRAAADAGTVAVAAGAASIDGFDPTPVWYREITVRGIHGYGPIPWHGESVHPYSVLLALLASGRLRPRDLVTHIFALPDYREAIRTALGPGGGIKVALSPNRAGPKP